MSRPERHEFLRAQAERLAAALVAEPFAANAGYDIGTSLVAADFASPQTLGATIEIIEHRLLGALGLDGPETRHRLAPLLGSLASGYAWALRDRTLDGQESIRLAALVARDEAEQELRASQARFRHAAMHDPLTGLPNRTLFADRLEAVFARPEPAARVAVCFVDLDRFKAVNDSLGHRVGDELLTAVAARLASLASEAGHLVARLGCDEFVVLMENTRAAEDAIKLADQVLGAVNEPFHLDGHDLPLTCSIGIVERPVEGTDPTEIMRAADMTLHWAKSGGKARWMVFDSERNAREVARFALAAAMPGALDRDEFGLVYQPIVGLADGELRGVEALARWEHPEHGTLPPDRFIDLAEDSGLIVPLGIRLLEQACREAAGWRDLSPRAPFVSVNLAVRQVRQPGLAADVAAVLDRTGLPAERLQLEITESAVMDNDAETVEALNDLAKLGVRLAIDDFGTGYSNLAYLRTLPVHGLKLAGRFVRDMRTPPEGAPSDGGPSDEAAPSDGGPSDGGPSDGGPSDEAVVAILVSLGHIFGLTVTAEEVETHEQAEGLRAVGCDTGQGWHLGRPCPPEHIAALVRAG